MAAEHAKREGLDEFARGLGNRWFDRALEEHRKQVADYEGRGQVAEKDKVQLLNGIMRSAVSTAVMQITLARLMHSTEKPVSTRSGLPSTKEGVERRKADIFAVNDDTANPYTLADMIKKHTGRIAQTHEGSLKIDDGLYNSYAARENERAREDGKPALHPGIALTDANAAAKLFAERIRDFGNTQANKYIATADREVTRHTLLRFESIPETDAARKEFIAALETAAGEEAPENIKGSWLGRNIGHIRSSREWEPFAAVTQHGPLPQEIRGFANKVADAFFANVPKANQQAVLEALRNPASNAVGFGLAGGKEADSLPELVKAGEKIQEGHLMVSSPSELNLDPYEWKAFALPHVERLVELMQQGKAKEPEARFHVLSIIEAAYHSGINRAESLTDTKLGLITAWRTQLLHGN
ncbi:MAG: hypothetical protein V1708_03345 [Candidatus Micrarchaeota archaeon]